MVVIYLLLFMNGVMNSIFRGGSIIYTSEGKFVGAFICSFLMNFTFYFSIKGFCGESLIIPLGMSIGAVASIKLFNK